MDEVLAGFANQVKVFLKHDGSIIIEDNGRGIPIDKSKGQEKTGIELSEDQLEKFVRYLQLLKKWNKVHNLTALKEDREILLRHFCDSLSLVIFFRDIGYNPVGKSLADIGTGAGFPGVPIKIYYRNLELHLVESVTKKCSFLKQLKILLKEDFKVHCTMAEKLDLKTQVAVARALEVKGKRKILHSTLMRYFQSLQPNFWSL